MAGALADPLQAKILTSNFETRRYQARHLRGRALGNVNHLAVMEQIERSEPCTNDRGPEKPKHSASRASGGNSEPFASLTIVPIGNGYGSRAGYAPDHGARSKQFVRISQMRTTQMDHAPDIIT